MANPTSGLGFVPVGHVSGAGSFTGQVNRYYVPSTDNTALFIGDPVVITGDFHTDGTPIIERATVGTGVTTDKITGAIVGVGSAQKFSAVRWGLAGNIVWAWKIGRAHV